MPEWQGKSKRMKTGGRRKLARKKRKFEIGGEKYPTIIGSKDHKKMRMRADKQKRDIPAKSQWRPPASAETLCIWLNPER